jgi:hypothetical protein
MKVAGVQETAGETATKDKTLELIRILENWLGAVESKRVANLADSD